MTTSFGSCPRCGTAIVAPGQITCQVCGNVLAAAPSWGAPQPPASPWGAPQTPPAQYPPTSAWSPQAGAPPAWPTPPAGAGYPPPPGQPAGLDAGAAGYGMGYGAGYAPGYPGYYPGYGPGYVPQRTNAGLIAGVAIVGVIALVVVLIAAIALVGSSRYAGSITYNPSSFHCGQTFSLTVTLPSSLHSYDRISQQIDSLTTDSGTVSSYMDEQSDGSWYYHRTQYSGWSCTSYGPQSIGTHTYRILNSSGSALAQGSYTITS